MSTIWSDEEARAMGLSVRLSAQGRREDARIIDDALARLRAFERAAKAVYDDSDRSWCRRAYREGRDRLGALLYPPTDARAIIRDGDPT